MTWKDDQRVLCDALLERGYRVEMRGVWGTLCGWGPGQPDVGWIVWSAPGTHRHADGSVCPRGLGPPIGRASTIPEAVALVVEHLDLDGRPLSTLVQVRR
jgi:hypothetical protein